MVQSLVQATLCPTLQAVYASGGHQRACLHHPPSWLWDLQVLAAGDTALLNCKGSKARCQPSEVSSELKSEATEPVT